MIPKIYGTVRIAPQIIYSSGIRAEVTETQERTGGKGGAPRQTVKNYNYYTTLALAPCLGEIESVNRIWANTDVIYSFTPDRNTHFYEAEDGTNAGGATDTADAGCSSGFKVTLPTGASITFSSLPNPVAPTDTSINIYTILTVYYKSASTRDLYVAVDGGSATAYSCPASASEVQVKTIHLDNVHPDSIVLSASGAAGPDIDRITIWYSYLNTIPEDIPVTGVYDDFIGYPQERYYPNAYYNYQPTKNGSTGIYTFQTVNTTGIRIYTGTETQTKDAAIIAGLNARYNGAGTDYCSAYRGIAYAVLEDYQVPNGNLPNFTMEVSQGMTAVDDIIEDLHALKGISSSYLDLTALAGMTISGIIINSLQSPEQTINQIEDWHNFKMVEMDGKRKAVLLNQASIITLTTEDLRAHEYGGDIPEFDDEIQIISEESLPKEIYVGHLNPAQDLEYKNESQRAAYFASTLSQDTISDNFPFIATPTEAQEVAERKLRRAHLAGRTHNFTAMPEFIKYAPGDVLSLMLDNATHTVEIIKKQASIFGEVQFQGVDSEEVNITTAVNTVTASQDLLTDTSAKFPANTELVVFESVPVDLTHEGLGIYAAVTRNGFGKWTGCALYNRTDSNLDWLFTDKLEQQAAIGVAQDTLADWTTSSIDTTNTLTIYFYENVTLETFTAAEILANPQLNLLRVGSEWLQFRTVSSVSLPVGSTYKSAWDVSNLTRGVFKTEGQRIDHAASENCVVYSEAVKFIALDSNYFDLSVQFTAATYGQTTDVSTTETLTLEGLSTGGQAPRDLFDRAVTESLLLSINTAATNTVVVIKITGYSQNPRWRKIYVSSNSDMSSSTLQPLEDSNSTGGTLPDLYTFTKTTEASAVHRYFQMYQSNNGIDYHQVSQILDVTFADNGGGGGSGAPAKPVITSDDWAGDEINISLGTAGGGTGNYQIEKSLNGSYWITETSSWSGGSPYSVTAEQGYYDYDMYFRAKRANNSSPYSDTIQEIVPGNGA